MANQLPVADRAELPAGARVGSIAELLALAANAYRHEDRRAAAAILDQILDQRPSIAAAWHLRGLCSRDAQRIEHAASCFMQAVSHDTGKATYCADLGDSMERLGRDRDATPAWIQAVALAPQDAINRLRLAQLLLRLGRRDEALAHFGEAVALRPDDAQIHFSFGMQLLGTEDYAAAITAFEDVLARAPDHGQAAFRIGFAYQQISRQQEAASWYRRALDFGVHSADIHANLAGALRDLGEPAQAAQHGEAALNIQSAHPRALNNLALALCDMGRHGDAVIRLEEARQLEPENLTTLHNLAVALHADGQVAMAEDCLRRLLARQPDSPHALRSLGNVLRESGRLEEAAEMYQAVASARPLDVESYGNLGLVLLNLNRPHEALAVYEKALALSPGSAEIRLSLGITQLLLGDYTHGWRNYEARWRAHFFSSPRRASVAWHGEPLADGKDGSKRQTLMVYAEQGFGDTLQFCRYLPIVARQGGRVVFECQAALAPLMTSLAAREPDLDLTITTRDEAAPAADFHAPLLGLPGILGTELSSVPAETPYLVAPSDKIETWASRLSGDAPAVGLVWSGNPERQDDWMRSCPTEALAPILAVEGVRFYSLQKAGPSIDYRKLQDVAPHLRDFGDTAAAVEALDLVISVDTAVAHLAGALNKPVWVMLGHAADWRYLLDREDSPWYPTMRLYRQARHGDWAALTARIAADLHHAFE